MSRAAWRIRGSRPAYTGPWVEVWIDDVQLPDGRHIDHHVLKFPRASVGAVVIDRLDRTLLLWRHRHITDTWGWEIPAGWAEPGEEPVEATRREVEEETGYRPTAITEMTSYKPMAGISTMSYTTYLVTDATRVGTPRDSYEASRIEWIPLVDIPHLAASGDITDGPSLTALAYYLGIHRRSSPDR